VRGTKQEHLGVVVAAGLTATRAELGIAGQLDRWHRIHGHLLIKSSFEPCCVRSYTHSIVLLFDRTGYVVVVLDGSDIFATRRTDVWDLE
jgi:hypothetical protein